MRTLRYMCGVTKLDNIRNERIKGDHESGQNRANKVLERRLKLHGQVMRSDEHYVGTGRSN